MGKRRANGEGTIYTTIQKNRRNKFLDRECTICKNCTNKCNRLLFEKCDKCTSCTECLKYCDRFYCYKTTKAQVSIKKSRKSVGYGKTASDVKEKKDIKIKELNMKDLIKNGELTLSEAMRENEKSKLEYKLINENSYNRNIQTIQLIENYNISLKKIYEIVEDDIKELFSILIELNISQSNLEKIYDEIHQVAVISKKTDIFESVKRNTFVSNVDKKEVIAFTIDEEKKILQYINEHENDLVNEKKSNLDNKTVKNLIKFAFASAMRIGEICSLDKNTDIDLERKRTIVRHTLTKNIENKLIIGSMTKTGRKKKRNGENDTRYVPFDILFETEEIEAIIEEQKQTSVSNLLFCTKDGKLIQHSSINAIFKRVCKEVGIKLDLSKGCHVHMTKHTGVTRMKENGMDIYAISKIVGTSVRVLTKTYAHIFDDFIEKEIEKSKEIRKENNLTLSNEKSIDCKIIPFSKYITVN